MTTFFRNYEKAEQIRNANAAADPDWQYTLAALPVRNGTRQAWIIEIRDEDKTLIGTL
jgi:hypothetical protein